MKGLRSKSITARFETSDREYGGDGEGWGAKVIDQLSKDMKGFSTRNLKYMRSFAEAWPDESMVQQAVAQIPWGHNLRLLEKVSDPETRRFDIEQTRVHGWSRDVLVLQIESRLHERQGQALTNFSETLPSPQSELLSSVLQRCHFVAVTLAI